MLSVLCLTLSGLARAGAAEDPGGGLVRAARDASSRGREGALRVGRGRLLVLKIGFVAPVWVVVQEGERLLVKVSRAVEAGDARRVLGLCAAQTVETVLRHSGTGGPSALGRAREQEERPQKHEPARRVRDAVPRHPAQDHRAPTVLEPRLTVRGLLVEAEAVRVAAAVHESARERVTVCAPPRRRRRRA